MPNENELYFEETFAYDSQDEWTLRKYEVDGVAAAEDASILGQLLARHFNANMVAADHIIQPLGPFHNMEGETVEIGLANVSHKRGLNEQEISELALGAIREFKRLNK